jgi:molybdopterin-containing oxidoreductase family iron-sulfur binding subunit
MDESRRNFLKIAGCATLGGLWAVPVVKAVAKALETKRAPAALSAQRWAMVIDLKRCLRDDVRQAAADACHVVHNVPDIGLPEEEIKWIWSEEYEHVFPTQVHPYTEDALKKKPALVLCNHCDRPPCVRVCPTQATWRRDSDGIVMMDMHRCIGCRYCVAACPYGSRSFNWRDPQPFLRADAQSDFPTRTKGVVEKCNFCAERLAHGQLPACVEAANRVGGPGCMAFGDLADAGSEVARLLRQKHTIRRKPGLGTEPQVFYVV